MVTIIDSLHERTVRKAVTHLRSLAKVDPERIGLWARGYRPQKIPRIHGYAGLLGFVILTIDCPGGSLYPERVASVVPDNVPAFLGFRNVSVDWKRMISVMFAGFQSAPHQLTILDESLPVKGKAGTDINWLDSLSGDFVSSISDWLDSQ